MIDTNFEKAFEVVDKARKQGIILFLENEKIKFKVPRSETISSDLLAEIKTYREQIRVMLVNNELYAQRNNTGEKITSNRPDGITSIPLSYSQERLWFIDRMGSSINYHISAALKLEGSLDKVALEYALRTIVNRHEILRTVIVEEDGKASQYVMDKDLWRLDVVSCPDNEPISPAFIKSLIDLPFDLAHDHMLRAHLVVKGPKEHLLVVVMHHIASDGWSVGITVKELAELYAAYAEGRTPDLPELDIQYADYAIWQRKYISGDISDKQLAYWKEKMQGVATLQLPLDFVRPAVPSTHGASYNIAISRELTAALKVLSLQQDVTLYMTLLAAFNVLLYHYSGQEDICVGSPTAGRTMQEVETLIGFFVNTLALRNNLSGNPSFTALLQNVKQTMMGAYDHQDLPFEKVVETVVKERDISRSPLFQVAFSLQNMPDAPELRLGDLQMVQVDTSDTTSKFDLTFFLQESSDGITGKIEYSVDLFGEPTIARMARHFEQLLRAIVAAPEIKIGFISILSDTEKHQLLNDFNDTAVDYPSDKSITELFALQVAHTPAATAVTFGDGQLTYAELDVLAGQLAVHLQQQGVTSGTLVPVCMNRSLDMMVGILAILKAGGAYVPVDPGYPRERIAYMLEDINCSLALTTTAYKALFEDAAPHAALIYMDQLPELPAGSLQVTTHAESLAYVIYTSGSTGKPKGVVVTHRNVTSLVKGTNYITLTPADRILSAGSLAFDAVTFEYWGMLLNGGTLILSAENSLLDPALLKKELHGRQVTKLFITTSWFNQLVDTDITVFEKLSAILTGGEKLSEKHLERFRQTYPDIDISNIYGPTENTTFSLSYLISKHGLTANTPIGTPLNNRTAYALSATRSLVPVGVAGELYVGGAGVAQGYLNQPVLTAERFIPHPFSNIPGDRLYKTGDIVRWTPDGFIEYLGRVDEQVKIRGFRVELGEIESTLLQSELVANAVVVALSDNTGQHSHKRLVAYIIPNGVFNREGIIIFLKQKLPEYMIPAVLVEMDKFPVTTNGKIDKKILPDPGTANREDAVYAAPRSATEEGLAGIWQELLGISRISIYDNFFELGGDSIITIQVVSRAKRAGFDLQPRDLFLHQTIASLAALLSSRTTTAATGEQGILTGSSGLLPIQQWYFETGASGNAHFNQSVLMSVSKQTDNMVLAAAVKQLSVYHDALRFAYEVTANGIMQVYGTHEVELETVDLQHLDATDLATFLPAQADQYHRQMDIRNGVLFRPVLLLTPATETHNRLLLVIHHLAVDGVSWRILLQDLELLLKNSQSGKSATAILGPKTTSYRQWYEGLVAYSHRNRLQYQQSYWEQIVQHYTPLPASKSYNGIVTVADTGYVVVTLDSQRTQRLLRDVPRVYHTEINDVLLCALAATLSAWTGRPDVLIGLEGHGREDIIPGTDTSRSVGWFTSMYPVLLQVAAGKQPGALLKDVKEQLRRVPDKGIGFGVLKYISKIPALQGGDAWDIIFNYLGQTDHVVRESGDLSVAPEASGAGLGDDFPVREKISVNSIIQDGELVLKWGYSTLHFDAADISTLADNYLIQLESLISHCMEQATLPAVYTPADYNLGAEITNEELDAFLDSDYKGASLRSQISGLYRLTGLQEGMLFHSLFDTQGGTYVEQFSCELSGVQEDLFRRSWDHLLQLHTILRSGFYHETFSIPVQCVYQTVQMPLTVYDYRAMDESTQAQAIKDFEKTDGHHGFDLKVAPLMRISLLHLKGDTYRMVWTFHHILFDGWSLPVMVEALLDTYEKLVTGKPVAVAGEDRYEDYIRYQERMDKELEEQYWRRYLAGLAEGSLLPFIGTTDKLTKGGGNFRETTFRLDSVVTENLTRFAQQNHITQNTLMQGVWAYLLYRYSGHRDVVYGTTVSGRPEDLPGVEKRVGLYINTLPLYTVIDPAQEITVWLQSLQNGQQQSREHQYVGLNEIQRWTNISGELFDSTITFQNYPVSEVVNAQTWQLQVSEVETHPHTNYPLTIIIGISDDTRLIFTYNNDLLSDYFIEMIARHFQQVITQLISNQAVYIRDIEPLGVIEQQQLENRTAVDVTGHYFLEMFERQAKENPSVVALVFEEEKLSYRALNKRASQLAGYLQERGVSTGSLVPLCMERGPDMIIGMLGILKAGGAYVPIEPDFPAERIKYMLEDTAAAVVVSSSSCRDLLPATGLMVVSLDDDRDEINRSTAAASLPVTPGQLLYVIYTSGSTGTPKGVMV
ncbi:amino acid adenylation domain-containing protein, partial [Chitinophaga sp. RAB17]|uniref:amino acid adenylation domain-containing protein n=1 Tax=Chitinophaga sp. RAB17 TaxID=3233049 RepID=UPI003F91C68C